MALKINGKLVTNTEAKNILNKQKKPKKEVNSYVGKKVRWFGKRSQNLPIYEGIVLSDDGIVCKIKGKKRTGIEEGIWGIKKILLKLEKE